MTLSTDSAAQSDGQSDAPTDATTIPPLRREVMVSASPETAFALFTAHIDRWWPLARHSVFGGDAMVAFEGDAIVERLGDQSSVWAEVTGWDPPGSLSLSWHPGRDASRSTDLTITFEGLDDGHPRPACALRLGADRVARRGRGRVRPGLVPCPFHVRRQRLHDRRRRRDRHLVRPRAHPGPGLA